MRKRVRWIVAGATLVASGVSIFFVWRSSFRAFIRDFSLAAGYRSVDIPSWAYLAHHSTPRALYFFCIPALLLAIRNRTWLIPEMRCLQCAVLVGMINYVAQGKGLLYHRYPWTAFACIWGALELAISFKACGVEQRWQRVISGITMLGTMTVTVPFYVSRALKMPIGNRLSSALVVDLQALQASHHGIHLDGNVQCLDGIAGCYSALFRLQLASATGMMGDQLLFQAKESRAVTQARKLFIAQLQHRDPTVIIETNYWMGGPQSFSKTATWPAFDDWLHSKYVLVTTRTFAEDNRDPEPIGYQIYILRDSY